MSLVRSISGLRATLGESLTPNLIVNYVLGFAKLIPEGSVVVGFDGRKSGHWIKELVIGSLLSVGRNVLDAGLVPTPTVQLLVTELRSSGGISITASHNPENWNGLKFVSSDGIFFDSKQIEALWEIVDKKERQFSTASQSKVIPLTKAEMIHINKIFDLPLFKNSNVVEKIKKRNFRVAVDCINASGSKIVPMLLERFGCQVIQLNCNGDGEFVHNPEPRPENLSELGSVVKARNADLGFAVDPDADRLVLVDESGNPVWEEMTIVLAVQSLFNFFDYFGNFWERNVVVNYSTTSLVNYLGSKLDFGVYRSPVGEVNVVRKMQRLKSVIGGEGSGGVILPACHYGRDSLVGLALVLALLAKTELTLSGIVSRFPLRIMRKYKISNQNNFHTMLEQLINKFRLRDYKISEEDGIYLQTADGWWLHLRRSNTEPIARIIFECENELQANRLSNFVIEKFEVLE